VRDHRDNPDHQFVDPRDDGIREVLPPNDGDAAPEVVEAINAASIVAEPVAEPVNALRPPLDADAAAAFALLDTNGKRDAVRAYFSAIFVSKVETAAHFGIALKQTRRWLTTDASGAFIVPLFLQRKAEKDAAARVEKAAAKAAAKQSE
jgi:hypothetical protein